MLAFLSLRVEPESKHKPKPPGKKTPKNFKVNCSSYVVYFSLKERERHTNDSLVSPNGRCPCQFLKSFFMLSLCTFCVSFHATSFLYWLNRAKKMTPIKLEMQRHNTENVLKVACYSHTLYVSCKLSNRTLKGNYFLVRWLISVKSRLNLVSLQYVQHVCV